MDKVKNGFNKKIYQEKLELAKGDYSGNCFAKLAGISPGNFCRMLGGQLAVPATLEKVAAVRPDIEYLYEDLMYAAGYATNISNTIKSQTYNPNSVYSLFISVPIVTSLLGSKNKIVTNPHNEKSYYPKSDLENGNYFYFRSNDDGLKPHICKDDMILFDAKRIPKNGDIVLFRLNNKEGLVRHYRQVNSKIIAYGTNPSYPPDFFNKNDLEIIGVAVKAILSL